MVSEETALKPLMLMTTDKYRDPHSDADHVYLPVHAIENFLFFARAAYYYHDDEEDDDDDGIGIGVGISPAGAGNRNALKRAHPHLTSHTFPIKD